MHLNGRLSAGLDFLHLGDDDDRPGAAGNRVQFLFCQIVEVVHGQSPVVRRKDYSLRPWSGAWTRAGRPAVKCLTHKSSPKPVWSCRRAPIAAWNRSMPVVRWGAMNIRRAEIELRTGRRRHSYRPGCGTNPTSLALDEPRERRDRSAADGYFLHRYRKIGISGLCRRLRRCFGGRLVPAADVVEFGVGYVAYELGQGRCAAVVLGGH